MSQGFVYVLVNQAMPGIVKIGRTARATSDRANELSTTGVPHDFIVVYDQQFLDCIEAERNIHEYFADFRINKNREFFQVSPKEVIDYIRLLDDRIENDSSPRSGDQHLYLYLAKIKTRKYRIGLFKTSSRKNLNEDDYDLLTKQLEIAYELPDDVWGVLESNLLCFYLDDQKSKIEKIIVNEIQKYFSSNTYWELSTVDDDQTIIVRSESFQDFPPSSLYANILKALSSYIELNSLNEAYSRKKLSKRTLNI